LAQYGASKKTDQPLVAGIMRGGIGFGAGQYIGTFIQANGSALKHGNHQCEQIKTRFAMNSTEILRIFGDG
jgi:hypothetical protein